MDLFLHRTQCDPIDTVTDAHSCRSWYFSGFSSSVLHNTQCHQADMVLCTKHRPGEPVKELLVMEQVLSVFVFHVALYLLSLLSVVAVMVLSSIASLSRSVPRRTVSSGIATCVSLEPHSAPVGIRHALTFPSSISFCNRSKRVTRTRDIQAGVPLSNTASISSNGTPLVSGAMKNMWMNAR
jgi:hypothetical protein